MGARRLAPPQDAVRTDPLPSVAMRPSKLVRISRGTENEPFFGTSGANRFDAPGCPASPEYAACYFGTTLAVAIGETVLHDLTPIGGKFLVPLADLEAQNLLRFGGRLLHLADLTGVNLKRIGGHADLAGTDDYAITQQWALAVYLNSGSLDGFQYMSRHVNNAIAVMLFDRAKKKLGLTSHLKLLNEKGFHALAASFRIVPV
ncbi:RES family NAD+ phosphorylase [Oxalobacteraceae bacterium OTU3REALA1]|nr:RES family NAD+ phosphorylase [Oxalobacteraceae bacterium OTU3REALA1]